MKCRNDGRCQYAIDHGAFTESHCPAGKCAMQGVELGPLPGTSWVNVPHFTYTADQMRSYASAEVAKERERCAKICESIENSYWKDYKAGRYSTHTEGMSDGAGECAAAIRAQK